MTIALCTTHNSHSASASKITREINASNQSIIIWVRTTEITRVFVETRKKFLWTQNGNKIDENQFLIADATCLHGVFSLVSFVRWSHGGRCTLAHTLFRIEWIELIFLVFCYVWRGANVERSLNSSPEFTRVRFLMHNAQIEDKYLFTHWFSTFRFQFNDFS